MAPTNCRAESRGSCVSVSSVITYFTPGRVAVSPTMSENDLVRAAAQQRNSGLRACRACARSPSRFAPGRSSGADDETGRRCRLPCPGSHRGTFRSDPRSAARLAAAAARPPAASPRAASRKSVSRPKWRLASRLARNRTSSASTRSSMLRELVRSVGTTTRVREFGGIPSEKSIRGSGRGVASSVASQFTIATARWLAHSNDKNHDQHQQPIRNAAGMRLCRKTRREDAVNKRDRAQVQEQWEPVPGLAQRLDEGQAGVRRPLELGQPVVDQVEPDVGGPIVVHSSVPRFRAQAGSPCAPPRFRAGGCAFAIFSTTWR